MYLRMLGGSRCLKKSFSRKQSAFELEWRGYSPMTNPKVIIRLIGHADNDLILVTKRCDQLCHIPTCSFGRSHISEEYLRVDKGCKLTSDLP